MHARSQSALFYVVRLLATGAQGKHTPLARATLRAAQNTEMDSILDESMDIIPVAAPAAANQFFAPAPFAASPQARRQ